MKMKILMLLVLAFVVVGVSMVVSMQINEITSADAKHPNQGQCIKAAKGNFDAKQACKDFFHP